MEYAPNPEKLAVLGYPVSHSKSPALHSHWIVQHHVRASYEAIAIPVGDFEQDVGVLLERGFRGFNVTLPHKENAAALAEIATEAVRATGAANTLYLKDDKLYADNTDITGFIRNIEANAGDFDWKGGPAVLIGAGGAARSVAYALTQKNVPELRIINRTTSKAAALAEDFNGHVVTWDQREEALEGANLVINATQLGMSGQPELDLRLDRLPETALVSDCVYTPLMTPLLAQAQRRGNTIVTGADMFFYQAQESFHLWFGIIPLVDAEARRAVEKG
ncbi:MAG: shikimate dehydrogenase [Pseudobdellovibrionaceae bacterium]